MECGLKHRLADPSIGWKLRLHRFEEMELVTMFKAACTYSNGCNLGCVIASPIRVAISAQSTNDLVIAESTRPYRVVTQNSRLVRLAPTRDKYTFELRGH